MAAKRNKKQDKGSMMPLLLLAGAIGLLWYMSKQQTAAAPVPETPQNSDPVPNSTVTLPIAAPPVQATVIDPNVQYLIDHFPELYTYYPQMTEGELATIRLYVDNFIIPGKQINALFNGPLFFQLAAIQNKYHVKFL
jgi:hypothetical protein